MKYNVNNNNLCEIISNIKTNLIKNELEIEERITLDSKYGKMKVSLEKLKNVLDMLKDERLDIKHEQKLLIIYNGNPYITLNLCILAILTKTTIILEPNECMIGINYLIAEIVNEELKNFQTEKLVFFAEKGSKYIQNVDKIICIDDINKYNYYLRQGTTKARFYSFEYIDLYCDSDELQELTEMIYQYAEDNKISIESYSELILEEAVEMMKSGLGSSIIILTNSEETKSRFKEEIKGKKIFVNRNPFRKKLQLIDKKIFEI